MSDSFWGGFSAGGIAVCLAALALGVLRLCWCEAVEAAARRQRERR